MHEGVDGLLHDKTRPPGKSPLPEAENGGEKVGHGSGGMALLRAAE
jgi:hypothetical protein